MTIFVQHTLIFVVSSKNLEKSAEQLQHRLQGLVDRARHHVEPKSSAKPDDRRVEKYSHHGKLKGRTVEVAADCENFIPLKGLPGILLSVNLHEFLLGHVSQA